MDLSDRFAEALQFTFELHRRQRRKGSGIPYMAHLMGVSALVLEDGGSEEEAIAGLLHDAPEDQGGRAVLEQIRLRFGEAVARIVDGCSDTVEMPKPPWRERKERYIAHLKEAPLDVLRVSLADKLYNARTILADLNREGDAVWERFKGGKSGTLWYYRALVNAFESRTSPRMLAELQKVVSQIELLANAPKPPADAGRG